METLKVLPQSFWSQISCLISQAERASQPKEHSTRYCELPWVTASTSSEFFWKRSACILQASEVSGLHAGDPSCQGPQESPPNGDRASSLCDRRGGHALFPWCRWGGRPLPQQPGLRQNLQGQGFPCGLQETSFHPAAANSCTFRFFPQLEVLKENVS